MILRRKQDWVAGKQQLRLDYNRQRSEQLHQLMDHRYFVGHPIEEIQ